MSVLRTSPRDDESTATRTNGGYTGVWMFAVTIGIALLASLQSSALLVPIGVLTVLVGRIWFAMQILREMAAPNALMVLIVPFMPTIFFFQRLEITWKPFIYGIMGIVLVIVGVSATRPSP